MPKARPSEPAYRWVIVFVSALILAISMGAIVNGISAFVVPMQTGFGWQRGDVSAINFAGIVGLALGGVAMGAFADRFGARVLVLFGSLALGASYLLASLITSLWALYVLFFLAGFLGAGALYPPVLALVGGWFRTGAGLALGIAAAGQALGQGAVPYLSAIMIENWGVAGAFRATGIVMLVTLLPLALLLRPPPAYPEETPAGSSGGAQAGIATRTLIIRMSAAIILCCTCMSVPLIHLVPLIQDVCAVSLSDAGSVAFVMLMVAIGGRLAFGKLADVIGAVPAYMSATAWMTFMVFGFMLLDDIGSFWIYAVIYGFGYGGVMTGVLTTMRELTPPARRASALGIVVMFGWFGHAIGGYQGGLLFDRFGDYRAAFAVAAIAGVLNLIIVSSLLRHSGRPRAELAAA